MRCRVLVVEDDRLTRLATERMLEKLGYEVVAVDDGLEAVEAVVNGRFAAVVMDCQMPLMDGFEATAEIRQDQAAHHEERTPIIGLSGRAMAGDARAALARGDEIGVGVVRVEEAGLIGHGNLRVR